MRQDSRKPADQMKIARERIDILFREASVADSAELANAYVRTARKIGMRYNIRLGRHRRKFCRKCSTYLVHGRTSRTKIGNGFVTTTCLLCGHVSRFPYRK